MARNAKIYPGCLLTGNRKAVYWYDRYTRCWILQVNDQYGNQIGDAIYQHTRREVQLEIERLIEADGKPAYANWNDGPFTA